MVVDTFHRFCGVEIIRFDFEGWTEIEERCSRSGSSFKGEYWFYFFTVIISQFDVPLTNRLLHTTINLNTETTVSKHTGILNKGNIPFSIFEKYRMPKLKTWFKQAHFILYTVYSRNVCLIFNFFQRLKGYKRN